MKPLNGERRKRADAFLILLRLLHYTAIISLFAALVVTASAKPAYRTFFDQFHNLQLRYEWDGSRLKFTGFLLFLSVLCSGTGLMINLRRLRRKNDHLHATLLLSLLIAMSGLFFYLRHILA